MSYSYSMSSEKHLEMSSIPQIKLKSNENNVISLIKILLVLCMRGSSLIIQLGTFPTENVYNIIFQNILDISISILSFAFLGYTIAYGNPDVGRVIGYGTWIGSENINSNEVVQGLCSSLMASSIITSQLSGRMHFYGTVIVALFYNGLLLPISMHLIWHEHGLLRTANIGDTDVSLVDYGGGFVIHATAGIVGLVGSYFLGPRLLRLSEIDSSSVGVESPGVTCLGYFLYMIGLVAMVLPIHNFMSESINMILISCVISIGMAIFVTIIIELRVCRGTFTYWSLLRCIQSCLAVLVFISPGVIYYNPFVVIVLSLISSVMFVLVSHVMHMSAIEDYCNITAVHTVSGLAGILFPKIYLIDGEYSIARIFYTLSSPLAWTLLLSLLLVLASVLIYYSLNTCGILRNKCDAICYRRNINVSKGINGAYGIKRLFGFDQSKSLFEPGISCKGTSITDIKCVNSHDDANIGESRFKTTSEKVAVGLHDMKSELNDVHSTYSNSSLYYSKACANGVFGENDENKIYSLNQLMCDRKFEDVRLNSSKKRTHPYLSNEYSRGDR